MGLKTIARNAALSKAADALEALSNGSGAGDGFLGWSMAEWKQLGRFVLKTAVAGAVAALRNPPDDLG